MNTCLHIDGICQLSIGLIQSVSIKEERLADEERDKHVVVIILSKRLVHLHSDIHWCQLLPRCHK